MVWSKEVLTAKKEGFTWFVLVFFLKKKKQNRSLLVLQLPFLTSSFF